LKKPSLFGPPGIDIPIHKRLQIMR